MNVKSRVDQKRNRKDQYAKFMARRSMLPLADANSDIRNSLEQPKTPIQQANLRKDTQRMANDEICIEFSDLPATINPI